MKNVYVFTGGASGMALTSAKLMCSEGIILLCDVRQEPLERAKAELTAMGADVYTCVCDVTDRESVHACAVYAASLGNVYAVIHAAGVTPATSPRDMVLKVNGLGPVNMTEEFLPVLGEGGVMLLFSSKASYSYDTNPKMAPLLPVVQELYSHWAEPDFLDRMRNYIANVMQIPEEYQAGVAYTTTKHFVRYFMKMNVTRFAKKNCRILCIAPGSYLTPMHQACIDNMPEATAMDMASIPLKRWGHPYEMAKLVEFLCSKGAGYINGVDILADGGGTMITGIPQIP